MKKFFSFVGILVLIKQLGKLLIKLIKSIGEVFGGKPKKEEKKAKEEAA